MSSAGGSAAYRLILISMSAHLEFLQDSYYVSLMNLGEYRHRTIGGDRGNTRE